MTKRAIESLKVLEAQDFTLIIHICFDLMGEDQQKSFEEMGKFFIGEVKGLREEETSVFSTSHLKNLRDYLDRLDFKKFSSLIDLKGFANIRLLFRGQGGWLKYSTFMKDWEKVMGRIEKDGMNEILEKGWI